MTLLAGDELKKAYLFRYGNPVRRASSFDLTIGEIFNDNGDQNLEPYILGPNEMVQVTSKEIFDLPDDITAHVSYKTGLTSEGIWALTVGIVDPGWNGPVSTTLFNFSKVHFPIRRGDVFLRVSFFQHSRTENSTSVTSLREYSRKVQKTAVTNFGRQFLDADKVAEAAGLVAMKKMRNSALKWIAVIAVVFTILQLLVTWGPVEYYETPTKIQEMIQKMERLEAQIEMLQGQKNHQN